jgi:hypothetical protein
MMHHPLLGYAIIDLPHSLVFSYSFLRLNFPQAKCAIVASNADQGLVEAWHNGEIDFLFVSADAKHLLTGPVDLALNTHSFGEMTQSAVDDYMQYFDTMLRPAHVYSVNRFRRPEKYRASGEATTARNSFPISAHYVPEIWSLQHDYVALAEQIHGPCLQTLMRRWELTEDTISERFRSHRDAALQLIEGTELWHYNMWNALRLYRDPELADIYARYFETHQTQDAPYYRDF